MARDALQSVRLIEVLSGKPIRLAILLRDSMFHFHPRMLSSGLLLALLANCGVAPVNGSETLATGDDTQNFYVAPQEVGDGRGVSQTTAANFRNMDFWSPVRRAVEKSPVVVNFLGGKYIVSSDAKRAMPTLALSDLGHKDHPLTLQGMNKEAVVFTRHPDDSREGKKGPGFLQITRSQNLLIRNLHFTGKHPIGYATHFGGNKNILIEGCSWIDLPGVYYGATGTADASTDHVTFRNCVFKRVGSGGHAHMAYNAYDPKHIRFVDCYFEDCAGDYVRFRDGTDFGVVVGCTFKSTGSYRNVNMPFIAVPLFNDDDPSKHKRSPNYEFFGTHFLISDNTFLYANDSPEGVRAALLFHHSGFDPPDRNHLLTSEQARLLEKGTVAGKKAFMLKHFGIDADNVHFFNNRFIGVDLKVAYRSAAAYGAKSKGWSGTIDITDTVNSSEVAETAESAVTFFD